MASKIQKSVVIDMLSAYQREDISISDLAGMFNISYRTALRYLRENKVSIKKIKRKSWNSGLTKETDERIMKHAKTNSKDHFLDGYKMVWSNTLNKSVREHHKVWFDNTGHWPNTKVEQIHHIDGDKLNNSFCNLLLCSVSEHSSIHKKYEKVAIILLKNNLIKFNKINTSFDLGTLEDVLEESGWKLEK